MIMQLCRVLLVEDEPSLVLTLTDRLESEAIQIPVAVECRAQPLAIARPLGRVDDDDLRTLFLVPRQLCIALVNPAVHTDPHNLHEYSEDQ